MSDPFHLDREDAVSAGSQPRVNPAEAPRSWRLACGDCHLEEAVRGAALGVHDPLVHALAVEMLHLLHHVGVLQRRRTVRANSPRKLVAGNWRTRCARGSLLSHGAETTVTLRGRRKRFASA